MEVNFCRHSFLTNHVISSLEDNCIICLNDTTSTDLLISCIANEFAKKSNKSSIILSSNCTSNGCEHLKKWIGLLSNLTHREFHDCKHLFNSNISKDGPLVCIVPLESLLKSSVEESIIDQVALLVVDLTHEVVNESILSNVNSIVTILKDSGMRIVVMLNINKHLTCPADINAFLSMCSKILPLKLKFASDSISISSNGNLIKSNVFIIQETVALDQSIYQRIFQLLNECKEVLSFYDVNLNSCEEASLLLENVNMLNRHLRSFGTVAFSFKLDRFEQMIEAKIDDFEESEELCLVLKFLKTKCFLLQQMKKQFFGKHLVSDCLEKSLCILQKIAEDETNRIRFGFLVESNESAEILLLTLQELKHSTKYDYLDKFSVFLMNDTWIDDILLNKDTIVIATAKSPFLHRLQLDRCISFAIPSDYCSFLEIKRGLKHRNGLLSVLIMADDEYSSKMQQMNDYQRIEKMVLKRMPSYIDPDEASTLLTKMKHNLFTFQPNGSEYKITPEGAIALVNRYCKFLSTGTSRAAIDHEFLTWGDVNGDNNGDGCGDCDNCDDGDNCGDGNDCGYDDGDVDDCGDDCGNGDDCGDCDNCDDGDNCGDGNDCGYDDGDVNDCGDDCGNGDDCDDGDNCGDDDGDDDNSDGGYDDRVSHDENASEMIYAQTKFYLPVKSMLRKAIQAPVVKLPYSRNVITKLKILSRMASSLEICKMLHESKELDETLTPSRKVREKHDEKNLGKDSILLTKNSSYRKKIPMLVKDSFPKQNQMMYIHVIRTRRLKEPAFESVEKYLGFCSTKRLPQFPSFLFGNRSDRIMLTVAEIERSEVFKSDAMKPMYNFHAYIFREVLKFESLKDDFSISDFASNGFLWTVLEQSERCYRIDYEFLEQFRFVTTGMCSKFDDAGSYDHKIFSKSCINFDDKIILPLHRLKDDIYYYAKRVCKDITVDDEFPNKSIAKSFIDYYCIKYGITLTPGKCMVDVIPVQKNLNFLELRYQDEGGHQKMSRRRQNTLIPEDLCLVHVIPAHLWMQIVLIPVIMYRLSMMLYLYDLQQCLIHELDLAESEVGPDLDQNLNFFLSQVHKERDCLGLQGKEDLAVSEESHSIISHTDSMHENELIKKSEFSLQNRTSFTDENNKIKNVDVNSDDFSIENCQENIASDEKKGIYNNSYYKSYRVDTDARNITCSHTLDEVNFVGSRNSIPGKNIWIENKDKEKQMPPLSLFLVALTSADAQDFFNYEKLEFLGDAFLAFAIAAELYLHHESLSENFLSCKKSKIVSNLNLFQIGCKRQLWQFIVEKRFDFRTNLMIGNLFKFHPKKEGNNQVLDMQTSSACLDCEGSDVNRAAMSSLVAEKREQQAESDSFDVNIRNKLVADCIESLIGLFYIHNGEKVTLDFMSWLHFDVCCIRKKQRSVQHHLIESDTSRRTLVPKCNLDINLDIRSENEAEFEETDGLQRNSKVELYSGSQTDLEFDENESKIETDEMEKCITMADIQMADIKPETLSNYDHEILPYVLKELEDFQRILKYTFKDKKILMEALLHPSYICRLAPPFNCNQRLEFLGDSILYLLTADHICRQYPYATNAELTTMRAIIVNTNTFAKVAYMHDFHKYILAVSPESAKNLQSWAKIIEEQSSNGEVWPKWSMSSLPTFHCPPASSFQIPKDLADVFESVAAAIYIDCGQLDLVWRSYYELLKGVLYSLP